VVTSMLEQPPEVRSNPDERATQASSSSSPPAQPNARNPLLAHPHTLPDGVRVRLIPFRCPHTSLLVIHGGLNTAPFLAAATRARDHHQ
jgi:hypothetical protein